MKKETKGILQRKVKESVRILRLGFHTNIRIESGSGNDFSFREGLPRTKRLNLEIAPTARDWDKFTFVHPLVPRQEQVTSKMCRHSSCKRCIEGNGGTFSTDNKTVRISTK
jgi:hypothetical protein